MSKVTEKDVLHLLQERVEKLQNKIKTIESVLTSLDQTTEDAKLKLKGKEKKVVKDAKEKIKKELRKNSKKLQKELAEEKLPSSKLLEENNTVSEA